MQLLVLLALMIASGLFAMSEMAIVSARKIRLQQLADEGNHAAQTALELAASPMTFLSTTQIGITLVGIIAGAFGEGSLSQHLARWLSRWPWTAPYREAFATTVVVLAVAYLTLVIGELAPKRVGLQYAERVACLIAGPMRLLATLARPLVAVLSTSTDFVVRVFGVRNNAEQTISEQDIRLLIEQATRAGVFTAAEEDLLQSAVRLGDREVQMLMTPRTEVVWLNLEDSPEELLEVLTQSHHSRFPVARGSLDALEGVVQARDVLARSCHGQPIELEAVKQRPLMVPETTGALRLIELFKAERTDLAVVIDEYGGVAGLVTLADLLESLVGEVPIQGQDEDTMAVRREDGSWLLDGLLPVDRFRELFDLAELPDEDRYVTVGGFVMRQLGRLPTVADKVEYEQLSLEVVDMDGKRVDRVLVCQLAPAEPDGAPQPAEP